MHAPTFRQLQSFIAAVETGSLSAAARSLQITQPAASQQVKELERALAARLLQRGSGRVRPTAAGEAVLARARRVRAAMDDLLAAAVAFQGGTSAACAWAPGPRPASICCLRSWRG